MKCSVCKEAVETHFLEKVKGTYFKKKGNLHVVCSACQQTYHKDEILARLS